MTKYGENTRAQLRQLMIANGVAPARAAQAVDLACHGAESAVMALTEVCDRASDTALRLMAYEVGLQLAASQLNEIFASVHALATASGCTTTCGAVEVPAHG
ncbi:hypothetical protein [Novosphingobium sp. KA1]|uniref:hypothetical protein n=1 Tax=Novosphingobium sp. (strain KA1) TaxID=164608 RepID=UPI001A8DD5DE|nr:hypothetical protein [Novosphingobium sp. KA1]QSR16033.1 hypothetical protein CA833_02280 [Novosphingobium sp. KA1]